VHGPVGRTRDNLARPDERLVQFQRLEGACVRRRLPQCSSRTCAGVRVYDFMALLWLRRRATRPRSCGR
jgi:hypothetical protein